MRLPCIKIVGTPRTPGEFQVEGYKQRRRVDLPYMMRNARYRIHILTTNLQYIVDRLIPSIEYAIKKNGTGVFEESGCSSFHDYASPGNPSFKVDIQTMDPESIVTNARAKQLNENVASYRDSLRSSLEKVRIFANEYNGTVEVGTYVTLPTLILFLVDDTVVFSAPFPSTKSRLTPHFVITSDDVAIHQFLSYFFSVKSQAAQQTLL